MTKTIKEIVKILKKLEDAYEVEEDDMECERLIYQINALEWVLGLEKDLIGYDDLPDNLDLTSEFRVEMILRGSV